VADKVARGAELAARARQACTARCSKHSPSYRRRYALSSFHHHGGGGGGSHCSPPPRLSSITGRPVFIHSSRRRRRLYVRRESCQVQIKAPAGHLALPDGTQRPYRYVAPHCSRRGSPLAGSLASAVQQQLTGLICHTALLQVTSRVDLIQMVNSKTRYSYRHGLSLGAPVTFLVRTNSNTLNVM